MALQLAEVDAQALANGARDQVLVWSELNRVALTSRLEAGRRSGRSRSQSLLVTWMANPCAMGTHIPGNTE